SNFIAEMLTKNLAARRAPPGTLAGGMAVLNGYMAALGLAPDHYQLTNPSGLTRQNRLSATALARVLDDMAGDFRVANEFLASLPIAGIDGTLENRMTATPARGWVRAKTGYIDGVVSLAGFAGRARGDGGGRVTFAFIYNGPAPAYRVRALFDRLSAALLLEPAAPRALPPPGPSTLTAYRSPEHADAPLPPRLAGGPAAPRHHQPQLPAGGEPRPGGLVRALCSQLHLHQRHGAGAAGVLPVQGADDPRRRGADGLLAAVRRLAAHPGVRTAPLAGPGGGARDCRQRRADLLQPDAGLDRGYLPLSPPDRGDGLLWLQLSRSAGDHLAAGAAP